MELTRIRRDRAVDIVHTILRDGILNSRMKPGERLNVDEMASKLGVSLTPVRQAIQQLASEGLVEVKPRSGTFVASLNARDIAETFAIRRALECLAAEDAVNNAGDSDLRRMKELLKSLRRPVRTKKDRKLHERNNQEIHMILVRLSGNHRLREMYDSLNAHLKIARAHQTESHWPSRLEKEQAEHEAIFAALERRDLESLKAALADHIHRAEQALLAAIHPEGAEDRAR